MSLITWAVLLLAGVACTQALGTQTEIGNFPSMVQIESRVGTTWLQYCVATVITNYHAVTAATCVADATYIIRRCRAGSSYRGRDGTVHTIYGIYNHPTFGQLDKDGNIAVVSLETAMQMGPNINQASIIGDGIYMPDNLKVTLASWGTTTEGGLVGNDNLYKVDFLTKNNKACLEKYQGNQVITENMMCVGLSYAGGRDLDSRDEGAPLFYQGVTVGIVSSGMSRGNDEYPIVATAIGSYSSWIVETAGKL